LNPTPVITTQYTDLTVQAGQTYDYWVTAVASDTLESPFSAPVQVTIPNGIAPSNYSISGQVTLSSQGSGAGATVTLTAASTGTILASTTTDSSGNFTLTEIPNGFYVVTPSSPTAVFTPASLNVTINGASYTTANFTAADMVFYDDFLGTTLRSAGVAINRHGDYSNGELQCYLPANVSVSGGFLTIATLVQNQVCGDSDHAASSWNYTSGMIQWNSLHFTWYKKPGQVKSAVQETSIFSLNRSFDCAFAAPVSE
jgi:hypothetical protein